MKKISYLRPKVHMILMHLDHVQEIMHYNKENFSQEEIQMIEKMVEDLKEFRSKLP